MFAAATVLKTTAGDDFVAEDIRADVADWNGDGLPDIITGSRSGSVKIAYNRGTLIRAGIRTRRRRSLTPTGARPAARTT